MRKKNRWSRPSALALIWFLWDVKEPTPLFEKSRGRRPRCCCQPSHITSFTSWFGWVQQAQKWTESGCQWRLCMLMSELAVHMLKCIVRGYVCCPLIHDSSFLPSFLHKQQQKFLHVRDNLKCCSRITTDRFPATIPKISQIEITEIVLLL